MSNKQSQGAVNTISPLLGGSNHGDPVLGRSKDIVPTPEGGGDRNREELPVDKAGKVLERRLTNPDLAESQGNYSRESGRKRKVRETENKAI